MDLFDKNWDAGSRRLVDGVHRILAGRTDRSSLMFSAMANDVDGVIASNLSRLVRERAGELPAEGPTERRPKRS